MVEQSSNPCQLPDEAASGLKLRLGPACDLLNRALDPWTEIENGRVPICRERSSGYLCNRPASRIAFGVIVCEKCAKLYSESISIVESKKEHWAIVHNLIERALDELA